MSESMHAQSWAPALGPPFPQPLLSVPGQVGDAVSFAKVRFPDGRWTKGCPDTWEQQDDYAWASSGP